jgi:cephalosporin hydroxylase
MHRRARPGPLRAIEKFVESDDRFEVDEKRSGRYLVGHSPKGWLRRVR